MNDTKTVRSNKATIEPNIVATKSELLGFRLFFFVFLALFSMLAVQTN